MATRCYNRVGKKAYQRCNLKNNRRQYIPAEVKRVVQGNLNFVEVDPDEIIVFAEKQTGKLKPSNISINDILTRQKNTPAGSIATFTKDGGLAPISFLMTDIEKKNAEQDKQLRNHIVEFNNLYSEFILRRNLFDVFLRLN